MRIRLPLTLGLLSAFGPFITDFYLPAMPVMGDYFHTSAGMIQLSLSTSVAGLAVGQVIVGPLSDKYGRRLPLLASLLLFIAATACCLLTQDIRLFNALRFLQGLGGAGGIVLSKSISTDLFSGHELARFMAILGAINGITPVVGPVVGGALLGVTSWQGIFVLVLLIGLLLFVLSSLLRETLPAGARSRQPLGRTYLALFHVLRLPQYRLALACQMAIFAVFFLFISSSPFLLQRGGLYALSPFAYSLCFALCTIAIPVGASLYPRFRRPSRCLVLGGALLFLSAAAVATALLLQLPAAFVVSAFVLLMFSFGLLQTPTTTLAMDCGRAQAGSAAAVLGALSFITGGIVSPLVSIGSIAVTTSLLLLLAAALGLVLACRLARMESIRHKMAA